MEPGNVRGSMGPRKAKYEIDYSEITLKQGVGEGVHYSKFYKYVALW